MNHGRYHFAPQPQGKPGTIRKAIAATAAVAAFSTAAFHLFKPEVKTEPAVLTQQQKENIKIIKQAATNPRHHGVECYNDGEGGYSNYAELQDRKLVAALIKEVKQNPNEECHDFRGARMPGETEAAYTAPSRTKATTEIKYGTYIR